jgi:predicted RNA-binding protein associated with RNAse of E/G family
MPQLIRGQYVLARKLNPNHQETWHYWTRVKNVLADGVLLDANFDGEDRPFYGMKLEKGDRFVERYYTDRWYNIYQIFKKDSGDLKGWYCNIAEPAMVSHEGVTFVDLALDVLVFPDGKLKVLYKDEFDTGTKKKSLEAVEELKKIFQPPPSLFGLIPKKWKEAVRSEPPLSYQATIMQTRYVFADRRSGSTIPGNCELTQSLPGRAAHR